jgi:KDO2-lipid IV(A) lauroyltransferase
MMKSFLATSIIRIFGLLPMAIAQRLGLLIGHLLYWLPNRTKQETTRNIARCLPYLDSPSQQRLVQKSLCHTAMAMMEMGHNWCDSGAANCKRVRHVEGVALLDGVRPRIIVTPHFGNWELFAAWLAQQSPLTALYKPAKLAGLDELISQGRQGAGMALAPASAKGVMMLKRALKKHESLLILPDQEPPAQSAIEATFFGQPAYTMTLVAQLMRGFVAPKSSSPTNAPDKQIQVLLGWAKRLGPGQGFAIELLDISEQCLHESLQDSVQSINDAMADLIAHHPEQYQWEYRRFKQTLEQ